MNLLPRTHNMEKGCPVNKDGYFYFNNKRYKIVEETSYPSYITLVISPTDAILEIYSKRHYKFQEIIT